MNQALPTNFENTAQTWQNMPMIAAMYTGQQNNMAMENNALLQKAFSADEAQKALEGPITLQNLMSTGRLQDANARHADALSRVSGLSADKMSGTMAGDIAATNAGNKTKVAEADVSQGELEARKYGQVASMLRTLPEGVPNMIKAQLLMQSLGLKDDAEKRISAGIAKNMDQMPDLLDKHATAVWEKSPDQRSSKFKEMQHTGRQIETNLSNQAIAAGRNTAQENIATTAAAARVEAVHQKALSSLRDRSAALEQAALKEQNPAKKAELQQAATFAKAMYDFTEQLRAATAKAGSLDIPGLIQEPGIPNSTPMAPPVRPGGAPPLPAAPAASGVPQPAVVGGPKPIGQQLSPAAMDWLTRAAKANPNMTNEQILAEGERLGKLK